VSFAGPGTAIVVGDYGTIRRTTDGGSTWIDQSIPPTLTDTYWLSSVTFGNSMNGIIVGKLSKAGLSSPAILRTTDGGKIWSTLTVSGNQGLRAASFGDANTVVAVGEGGTVLRSFDAGLTWTAASSVVTKKNLNGVFASGPAIATAVGDAGTIIRSTDGGSAWILHQIGTSGALNSVWLVSPDVGLVVGDDGLMLTTTDGATTWSIAPSATTYTLHSIWFTDAQRGAAVGEYGTIIRTMRDDVFSAVGAVGDGTPGQFALQQNYPNPFNPTTAISYQLIANSFVTLRVFDILGREVVTLVDGVQLAGTHIARWDASKYPSGVYLYRLVSSPANNRETVRFVETKKMVLVK
jgi:photosystem II stability/assembly factor-like uncharacterized protein